MRTATRQEQTALGWRELARGAGVVLVVLLGVAAARLRDPEAAAFAVAGIAALGLLRWRSGLLGLVALTALCANVGTWMTLGAVSNLAHGDGFWVTALPLSLAVAALVGAVGAVGAVVARHHTGTARLGPRVVAGAACVVLTGGLVAAAVGIGGEVRALPTDIRLETEAVRFSRTELVVAAGQVGVFVSNGDLFWHTFTVAELGVNLNVPVGAKRRVDFEAAPGIYEFFCAVPGHPQAGMRGTLTVR